MHKLVIFLATLFIALSAHAEPPTSESIDVLFATVKTEKMLDSVYSNTDKFLRQSLASSLNGEKISSKQEQFIESLVQTMREELSWAKMRPLFKQIYQESFTQEEIDGLIAFYKSPAGTAFLEKMPLVTQKTRALMQPIVIQMTATMQEKMEEVLK